MLDENEWNSTISFAAGIPVALDGTLALDFASGVNVVGQIGHTFHVLNWTGVNPTGNFTIDSSYDWDLSALYTSRDITLTAVPEPSTWALAGLGAVALLALRKRRRAR